MHLILCALIQDLGSFSFSFIEIFIFHRFIRHWKHVVFNIIDNVLSEETKKIFLFLTFYFSMPVLKSAYPVIEGIPLNCNMIGYSYITEEGSLFKC